MGACTYTVKQDGPTMMDAFRAAQDQARYEHGHGGYSGTIAEKTAVVVVGTVDTLEAAYDLADRLLAADDSRISDKWGPSGCIWVGRPVKTYVFVGWASS